MFFKPESFLNFVILLWKLCLVQSCPPPSPVPFRSEERGGTHGWS